MSGSKSPSMSPSSSLEASSELSESENAPLWGCLAVRLMHSFFPWNACEGVEVLRGMKYEVSPSRLVSPYGCFDCSPLWEDWFS